MGCTDDVIVEREAEFEATPEEVWAVLPALFEDDDRARVVDREEPPDHLSFYWSPPDHDDPPSHVTIDLEPSVIGTIVHIRETRLDGANLVRSAFSARARV